MENALKLLHDVEERGDVRVIQTALRELRYAFKLFAPYAGTRKVTIFGSARTQPNKIEYQQAVEFGRKIADAGFMVITGAGPGIMQAGHEGAGPERSFGANIRLPWEQNANPVILQDKKLVTFKYFSRASSPSSGTRTRSRCFRAVLARWTRATRRSR